MPKPHYSWYRCTDDVNCGWSGWSKGVAGSDNNATLIDYARITHSMPVTHGATEPNVVGAVQICIAAGGNCSLSLDWSPCEAPPAV